MDICQKLSFQFVGIQVCKFINVFSLALYWHVYIYHKNRFTKDW